MTEFVSARSVRQARLTFNAPPETVFPLLCPVREYDWIEIWDCRLIHTTSGAAEDNCVFATDFPHHGGEEIWTVSRYDPPQAIEFIRFSPGHKITRLDIHLSPAEEGKATALWRKTFTGLSEKGNRFIDTDGVELFDAEVERIETMMNYYLEHGSAMAVVAGH
jgi:hypothetical protein